MTGAKGVAQGQGFPEGFGEASGRKACVCVVGGVASNLLSSR